MFYEQSEEIIELDKSFEKIENAKKSIDFNLREKSKGMLPSLVFESGDTGNSAPEVHHELTGYTLVFASYKIYYCYKSYTQS